MACAWRCSGCLGRGARAGLRAADPDPPDRGEPALGAGPDGGGVAQPAAASAASSSPTRRPRAICDEDVAICRAIGEHGLRSAPRRRPRKQPGEPVNILTHCNAGWLATIDWGTATAPIYLAQEAGIPVHVWVDETRPRNQGAALTAFELLHQGCRTR